MQLVNECRLKQYVQLRVRECMSHAVNWVSCNVVKSKGLAYFFSQHNVCETGCEEGRCFKRPIWFNAERERAKLPSYDGLLPFWFCFLFGSLWFHRAGYGNFKTIITKGTLWNFTNCTIFVFCAKTTDVFSCVNVCILVWPDSCCERIWQKTRPDYGEHRNFVPRGKGHKQASLSDVWGLDCLSSFTGMEN